MNSDKQQRLQEGIASIRRAHGEDALRPLGDFGADAAVAHLSTGFVLLDHALGIGGVPRGHLTQVSGIPTSGAMTLAWKTLAQAKDEAVLCIDMLHTYDADYAARCGVALANLLLVQPASPDQALEVLTTLVDAVAAAVVVFDIPDKKPRVETSTLHRLLSALHRSRCALLVAEHAATPLFSEKAAIRLHFQRSGWLRQRQDINGYRTQVRILKNRWGHTGQRVSLVIGFSGVVQGDGA